MAKKKAAAVMELPVAWGNLNVGDTTCRLGVSISRANLTVAEADKHLCEKRLTGRILARANGARADQPSLPGADDDTELKGSFDVKGFSATGKAISTGLTFMLSQIEVETLARFARREGMLTVNDIEDLPEESANGDE